MESEVIDCCALEDLTTIPPRLGGRSGVGVRARLDDWLTTSVHGTMNRSRHDRQRLSQIRAHALEPPLHLRLPTSDINYFQKCI